MGTGATTAIDIFDHFGMNRRFEARHLIDSCKGEELLIVGSGRCVWDDVNGLCEARNVMAVNDMGMYWPGFLRHWYSNDVHKLVHWTKCRRDRHVQLHGFGWRLHSCFQNTSDPSVQVHHWPFPGQGSSGLVAILVALALGYDSIIVAGIPFDDAGHFFDPPGFSNLRKERSWSNFLNETPDRILERTVPLMKGRVRALSGRLRGYLG